MKRALMVLLLTFNIQFVYAQAVNKKKLKSECKTYELNSNKIKVAINSDKIPFSLEQLEVKVDKPLKISFKGCENKLIVTTPNSSLQTILSEKLNQVYPKLTASLIKIVITDLRVLENALPTRNARLYISMDYLLKNDDASYSKVYASSGFYPIDQYIEKPIGKILTRSITEFFRKKLYINELKPLVSKDENSHESILKKGLYTNFEDLLKKEPTYQQIYSIKTDKTESFRTKYFLRDKDGLKVSVPVLAFSDGQNNYINIEYYYSKRYFVELSEFNSSYYFIYDRIQDLSKASKKSLAAGGGLLGLTTGSALAGKKAPALINKMTGEMISYDRKTVKNLLSTKPDLFEEYKTLLNAEKRVDIFRFLERLADIGFIK